MPRKAEISLVVKLQNPDDTWSHVSEASFEKDESLAEFLTSQVAKIMAEGGILETKGQFSFKFIPINRIVDISVHAEEKFISLSTDVGNAATSANRTAAADKMMREPIPFGRKH